MRVGPRWRLPRRVLALCAALTGLAVVGLGPMAFADEPEAKAPSGAGAKPEYLDEMIREAWEGASVKPSPTCTDEEFLRRAYLDVLGRIPNLEEAMSFLQSREKGKRAKLVEYLLNHPDFA